MDSMMPHNKQAEEELLAALMQYDNVMDDVLALVSANDFYVSRHQSIFSAMRKCYDAGEQPYAINIAHAMNEDNDAELLNFLMHLANCVAFRWDAVVAAKIVANEAKRRRIMQYGNRVFGDAAHESDAAAVLERAEFELLEIGKSSRESETQTLTNVSLEYMEMFSKLEQKRGDLSGLPTGFRSLDFLLRGMREQNMLIVAGRPGSGKSSLALSMAYHLSFKCYKSGMFFSLEMSKRDLFERLVSIEAQVDSQRLRTPWELSYDERERVHDAINRLESERFVINDTQAITTTDLRSEARRFRAQNGELDYIIVDYLQLMRANTSDGKRMKDRQQEIAEISMSIKALAKELNVPIIALAQLNREVENRQNKVPQLWDLRESGQIEQDSDVVMFVYRDEMYNADTQRAGQADIVIAKHRHGPTGEVTLHFEARYTQFTNMEVEVA